MAGLKVVFRLQKKPLSFSDSNMDNYWKLILGKIQASLEAEAVFMLFS
jgi:hypothetical protein